MNTSEIQYLSKLRFAESQGWSPSYVSKLGSQGRLVLDEGKKLVNVTATLAGLRKTSDPGKSAVRERHQATRVERQVTDHIQVNAPVVDEPAVPSSSDPKYWDNKTRREGALAEMAELELSKKRGELVDRPRVEAMAFAAGRTLRDSVLGLPTRLAPLFATMTDPFEIEVQLRNALRQVFADAAKMTNDDLVRSAEQSH